MHGQSHQVGFPENSTPVFDTGTNVRKEIAKIGKFEMMGEVMSPLLRVKTFIGKTPEGEISRADVNGTTQAKYRATVTAVTPTGTGDQTEGPQGQIQRAV